MGDRDWQPFVYGGLASCTAEFGMCSNKNSAFFSWLIYSSHQNKELIKPSELRQNSNIWE
jgi:hypothetical protein